MIAAIGLKVEKNKVAEVTFGGLAKTANANPTWNRKTARCTNTYCHGATLSGGRRVEPVWTKVDKRQIDCDGCHGNPPPLPHPQNVQTSQCATCHPDTVDGDGKIKTSEGKHINGTIESRTE
jgi:predicted CxxxxCH...CXXCH cytochrome family protein